MNNVFDINVDPDSFTSPTEKLIWARAKLAIHRAKLAKIEAKVKTGQLNPVAEVRRRV